jgi:hypothetical protein
MIPGFYTNDELPNDAYQSGEGVSNSGLKLIGEKTPRHFFAAYFDPDTPERPQDQAKFIGSATHAATLEIATFGQQYVVAQGFKDRRSGNYKAWAEAQTRMILMPDDYRNVMGMRKAMWAHPLAGQLLADICEFECSAYAIDPETGVLCRIRMDGLTGSGRIIDVKKTQDASDEAISKTMEKYGYYHQDAFYTDVLTWACGEPPDGFDFIFVEEQYPHCVNVVTLENEDRDRGRRMYRKNLNLYAQCLATNSWPAYGDERKVIGLSHWARTKIDQQTTGIYL